MSVLRHPMHPKITFTLRIEYVISKDKFSKQRPSTGVTLDDVVGNVVYVTSTLRTMTKDLVFFKNSILIYKR